MKKEPRSVYSVNSFYKTYNITGEYIEIKLKNSPDAYLYRNVWLPAKVIAEYMKFIIVEILPHFNPNQCYDESKPYCIGINKSNIMLGDVIIKNNGKRIR